MKPLVQLPPRLVDCVCECMYETHSDVLCVPQLHDAGGNHIGLEAVWVEVSQESDMVWGEEKAPAYGTSADLELFMK